MKSTSPIKAIVFDFGGVIQLSSGVDLFEKIADTINISVSDFRDEYYKHNHLINVEDASNEAVILRVVSIFDSKGKTKDSVLSIIKENKTQKRINKELVDFFPRLRERGFKIAIFSNHGSNLRSKLEENGIRKLVDNVVISSEIGFQKPSKEAFNVLFEMLEVQPHEVVFIDDSPKSLENAGQIGYVPILFKNNDELEVELQRIGVHI